MSVGKKVLVVDDDPDILEALQLTFESADFVTKTLAKGEETYELVDEFQPDIIVLDVVLSGKDGRHICKNLKLGESTKNIPIVMISAHPDAKKSTLAVGADDFLAKPFTIKELIEMVKKYTVN